MGVRSTSASAAARTRAITSALALPIFSARAAAAPRAASLIRSCSALPSSAKVVFGSAAMPSATG